MESNWVHSTLRPPMAYCASPGWLWWWRNLWNDWQGKLSEKTCPSAALSATNPTCCPDANPGRRGGKPASNRLSYGTARDLVLASKPFHSYFKHLIWYGFTQPSFTVESCVFIACCMAVSRVFLHLPFGRIQFQISFILWLAYLITL
jgi:hypothetical protein